MKKAFQFIWLVLKDGNLFQKPLNFYDYKIKILGELSIKIQRTKKLRVGNSKLSHSIFNIRSFISEVRLNFRKELCVYKSIKNESYYLRIPKCGSTSILHKILINKHPEYKNWSLQVGQIDLLAEELLDKISIENVKIEKVFCVIRNPFQRLVSAYLDVTNTKYGFIYQNYLFGILKPDDTFEQFVEKLEKIPGPLLDQNFRPQMDFISDKVIKLYKLEDGLENINSEFPNPTNKIGHFNKSSYNKNWMDFYSEKSFNKALLIYQYDIEKLNYNKEMQTLKEHIRK